jgi:hypothetical protein
MVTIDLREKETRRGSIQTTTTTAKYEMKWYTKKEWCVKIEYTIRVAALVEQAASVYCKV